MAPRSLLFGSGLVRGNVITGRSVGSRGNPFGSRGRGIALLRADWTDRETWDVIRL